MLSEAAALAAHGIDEIEGRWLFRDLLSPNARSVCSACPPGVSLAAVAPYTRSGGSAGFGIQRQIAKNPPAMNLAICSLIATKSSDRLIPPDNLSIRPVRARVSISAPVTK